MANEQAVRENYDSTRDTMEHITNIKNVFDLIVIPELNLRKNNHDVSKLSSPEKETYDKYIPLLRTAKYGTKKYQKMRDDMTKEGLSHHYEVNRHHPEHFDQELVNGMNLIDFVEMICDWFAASLKSDTDFMSGLKTNVDKYDLPDMIVNIIENTYKDYFRDFEYVMKHKVDNSNEYIKDLKLRAYEAYMNTNPYQCTKAIESINNIVNK